MITSVELGDFLSHSETKLDFDNGVTVFVGHNGAGKSSIIDAITFALFGKHTRKSSKGLIKRGATQGFSKVEFMVNGIPYQAVRKIDSKGTLAAKFSKKIDGETIEIAAGERKQFGESMTNEIEKTIGLDFEKLKIASIVQQGELNSIIKAKPKEFKELLNAIIGIDKLDVASNSLKEVNRNFRDKIKEKLGYDDTHIDILKRDLERYQNELLESKPQKERLEEQQKKLQNDISKLRIKIDEDAPKIDKIKQLEIRKNELQAYARDAIREIQQEIREKERKIDDCEECLEYLGLTEDLEAKIDRVNQAITDTQKKIQELSNKMASLKEKKILAVKLQLKDNKCPVCDSEVEKLNPLFQKEHLEKELEQIQDKIKSTEIEQEMYNDKKRAFSHKLQKAIDAEATLKAHAIRSKEELEKIKEDIEGKKISVQKIPTTSNQNFLEMSQIDSHSKLIFETISKLEKEIQGFDEREFINLKNSIDEKQMNLSNIDQQLGAIIEKISKNEKEVKTIQNNITELSIVKKYMLELDSIQTKVFSRDGSVATSLRSWALNAISTKASEYLTLLNTKIQRIQLSEKARDITITCHSRKEVLDLESLSGGEQVSVALALRLGMANLLGASNLNLMILDEPTTHLDAERKKSLVSVLSQLSNISNSEMPMQFIIITHDAEIFEDSTVEKIYSFESTENGSTVKIL
ncbi:MAG: SMC family ATPase [Nitrosopumilaceae archaeon]|uniref:SMC family ATPase n=2 Tax=Candidatus Nitrosomaritimum aestuariumsis TaxID=3342354 RepID=A0AC60W304_9ARCH|nr:SMC family ATPase [Nitrosopumilaceae archaeon]MBA4460145.1 SMC family ATPase [Nitrosopumilaceae archaeon]MBA4461902.1 SMC family ATPase [Nitrosopumilaceae archaeon]MBA4464214.1 SMC family ATPase [Nitrosopumilaceae archaeon]